MIFSGAIFDLDGTLFDSMKIWNTIGEQYLNSLNIYPHPGLRDIVKSKSLLQSAQYFRQKYNLSISEEIIMQQINDLIAAEYQNNIQFKPYAKEFLAGLYDKGIKMAIATATDHYLALTALKRLNADQYFQFIITCTEVSSGKDQPDIFLKALEKLGTNLNETVVFEDALHAIVTAKNAGFKVVAVYDDSAAKEEKQIRSAADRYILSFDQW